MTPETILLEALSAPVVDRVEVPPRPERRVALPAGYDQGQIADWLTGIAGGSGELWSHQALALEHYAAGKNVGIATGTASGKTLIPMAVVIKRMLESPTSTFLVLYPQKSLLSDQLNRWQAAFKRAQLNPNLVSAVDGEVATEARVAAFETSNLILATDDIIHAWAMANHAAPFKRGKQRNYSTTGVILRIREPWFTGQGGSAGDMRKLVAEALLKMLALERGIALSELAYAHHNIALHDPAGPRQIDDAIVVFDDLMGGMRLTAPLSAPLSSGPMTTSIGSPRSQPSVPETLAHDCAIADEISAPALHLATSLRSFRAERLSDFVGHVIAGDTAAARAVRVELAHYPLLLTRDLSEARQWLRQQRRGPERAGLLASSNGARLKPHGIFVKAKIEPGKWFLAQSGDVRASDALEDAGTEFDVQGLELDWACVCWDANLRRVGENWQALQFKGTTWQAVNDPQRQRYVANSYRVLLTRARQGLVVFVPEGDDADETRPRHVYDRIHEFLSECGFSQMPSVREKHTGNV